MVDQAHLNVIGRQIDENIAHFIGNLILVFS